MDTDLQKSTWERQRRNLVAISIALAIYGLAGGELNPVSLVGGGVVLETPGTILWVAHIAWLYLAWRYWLYSRDAHAEVRRVVLSYLHSSSCFQTIVQEKIDAFQRESGVEFAEGWQNSARGDDENSGFRPIPIDDSVRKGWFKRTLVLEVDNPTGEFHPDQKEVDLPFVRYQACFFLARMRATLGHYLVSDIYIPYGIGMLPAVAAVWQWLYV